MINSARPIVQDSADGPYVEIYWPDVDRLTVIHEEVALAMFIDMMRIVTDEQFQAAVESGYDAHQ